MSRVSLDNTEIDKIARSNDVRRMLERAAEAGAEGARRKAPVDTGNLRNSIDSESEPGRAWYGTDVDYAIHQEFGTRNMSAHAFLRPALDDAKRVVR